MTEAERRLQAAMAQVTGDDVAELIAAARVEARERVRAVLVQAMTEAMLDRARELGASARTGGGPDTSAGSPAAEPTPEPTGFYVYCVVAADTEIPAGLEGIDSQHSPTLLRHEGLAAVVSRVPLADFDEDRLRERLSSMDRLEPMARTHEHVLDTIGKHTTLIPMRLCSVYRNARGVIEMLSREGPALQDALEHLEGKTEWGVKVFALADKANAGDHASEAASEDVSDSSEAGSDSGTGYMRRRQGERDQRRDIDQDRYETCVTIHARLAELASAALTSAPQRPEVSGHPGQMLLNGVYLIENHQRDAFLALVDELQGEHASDGLELQASGPWPAYNFVPGTIGAAW